MKTTYLLFPGNPAVSSYYEEWVKEIEANNMDMKVLYASSSILFEKRFTYEKYNTAMIEHYECMLLTLTATQPISIIAHSVGGYFALRLLEKHPEKISKLILLFPYIGESTISLLKLVGIPYTLDRYLPLAELVAMGKNVFAHFHHEFDYLTKQEVNVCLRLGIRQCTYFNHHIFTTDKIAKHAEKINLIYCKNDRWSPLKTIDLLKPISYHKEVELPHDFILSKENRMRMMEELQEIF